MTGSMAGINPFPIPKIKNTKVTFTVNTYTVSVCALLFIHGMELADSDE